MNVTNKVTYEDPSVPGHTKGTRCQSGEPMITLRRAKDRHHDLRHKQEVWNTFYPEERTDALADGFGALEILNETRVPPGADIARHPHHDAEIVTYVREGALAHEDSMGRSGVIRAGEFQCRTTGRRIRHSETNASQIDWAHIFQIWLRPSEADLEPSHEQKRFCVAERRGLLRVIASPDGRRGSLRIHQAAVVYSALLDAGQHLVHELAQGRSAWLHIVRGEVVLGDVVLTAGDGVGVTAECSVSLTAREDTELLLVDLGAELPRLPKHNGVVCQKSIATKSRGLPVVEAEHAAESFATADRTITQPCLLHPVSSQPPVALPGRLPIGH